MSSCLWCAREADFLCDHVLGFSRREGDGTIVMDEPFTCDAPMCDQHRRQVSHIGDDTWDLCHAHRDAGIGAKLPGGVRTAAEADRVRRELFARARRTRIGLVR